MGDSCFEEVAAGSCFEAMTAGASFAQKRPVRQTGLGCPAVEGSFVQR